MERGRGMERGGEEVGKEEDEVGKEVGKEVGGYGREWGDDGWRSEVLFFFWKW